MNEATFRNELSTMRFGRAMHMDLSRASDEKLAAAYKVLDDYDTSGQASAYTQDKIDARLAAIDDEGDRRAGITPVAWNPAPTLHVVGVSSTIAEYVVGPQFTGERDTEEVMDDDDTPAQERAEIAHIVDELPDPVSQTDGMVPGETSDI